MERTLVQLVENFYALGTVKVTIGPAIQFDEETDAAKIVFDLEMRIRSMEK